MKICVIADVDPANQCSTLWRALNRYTDHEARYIVGQSTYLGYDEDLNMTKSPKEEIDRVIKESEFYILVPVALPRMMNLRYGLTTMSITIPRLNPRNHLVWLVGSLARRNPFPFLLDHTLCVTSMDYTTSARIPSAQHIPIMLSPDEIPELNPPDNDKIRLCHSPTNRQLKSTDVFLRAVEEVKKTHPGVELELIENKSWKESLAIKATCHIYLDQLKIGAYGCGAVESWMMGQPVIVGLNDWVYSFHPELTEFAPKVDEKNVVERLEELVTEGERGGDFPPSTGTLSASSRPWVEVNPAADYARRVHAAENVVRRWDHLIEFVRSR